MNFQSLNNQKLRRIGGLSGIIIGIFFPIMWTAAVIVDGAWRFGEDTLSELGSEGRSSWIFNSAVIISGLLAILFSLGMLSRLSSHRLGLLGGISLSITSVVLILVGVFPTYAGQIHTILSVLFFGLAALTAIILLHPLMKRTGVLGIPFLSSGVMLAVSFPFVLLAPMPLAEAVAVICLLIWSFILGLWMLIPSKNE